MHGFCHFEIPCTNFEKIGKFYTDVFGWNVQIIPEMDYAMFRTPSGPGGGFDKRYKISKDPGIVLYIEVEEVNAALKKIEAAGGKTIRPKTQISPEYGYYAFFGDIEGNTLGLWSKI
ncbi:MAG: VOC family protein [Candidatus Zixiibacteriota bacterium]